MNIRLVPSIGALAALLVASGAAASTVNFDGSNITSIDQVDIGGVYWDVTLLEEYDGSTYSQSFALDAANALLGLFSGQGQLSGTVYDIDPETALGCVATDKCEWRTAITAVPDPTFGTALSEMSIFFNFSTGGSPPDQASYFNPTPPNPAINFSNSTYLNWTESAMQPVPLPAAAWLFGSALGLLGWIRRKKA